MKIQERVPLALHTTFRTGGPARFFVHAETAAEVEEAVSYAKAHELPLLVLGGGSNMLAGDEGCDGLVLRIGLKGIFHTEESEGVLLTIRAGESWDAAVAYAVEHGWWGVENLSGIPGTAGAAPVQNIGAYGASLEDTFVALEAFDMHTHSLRRFTKEECAFSYRDSLFKREGQRYIILSIQLRVSRELRPRLSYRDLAERFANTTPSLRDIREGVLAIRHVKFPDLSKEGTAGSFFMNPILTEDKAKELRERYPDMPQFKDAGRVKIPLAWILDKVLGLRGEKRGGVRAFERQPLVLVNDGSASTREIREFARSIQERVAEKTGIQILPEVCILHDCVITREL